MIERFIDYVVEADGKVTCDGSRRPQTAGVQGDDGACTLNFDLSAVYSDASHYFIEFVCGSGTPIILSDESDGVTFDADSKTLSVLLGKEITAEGGRVEVCVVEEVLDEESNKAVEGNTYVTYIKFDPKDGIMQRFKNTAYGIFIDFKLMIKKCSEVLNDANKTLDEVKTVKKEVEAISSIVVESLTAENTQYQDENVTGNYLTINAVFYKDGIQYSAFKQLAINIVDNFTNVITSETNYFSKYYIKAVNLIPFNNSTAYGKCELEIIEFSNTDAEIESEVDNLSLILGTFETADWGQYAEDSIKVLPDKLVENVKSAYEIAVENGFKGTEAEWLESLKGEDSAGSVKYTETQNLTEEEKNTARTNIFAMPYFEVTDDSPLEFVDITDENGNIVENAPRKLRMDMSGEISYDDDSTGMKLNKGVGLTSDGNTVFVNTDVISTREYAELTAQSEVNKHNVSENSHNDIRLLVDELSSRIKALLDCDDKTLDQTSEIVTYIKSNKELIDSITTAKVNVADIIDNLITNVSDKPLSAKQGVVLKELIDAIVVPTKVSELTDDVGYAKSSDVEQSLASKADKENGYEVIQDTTLTEEIQAFEFTDLNLLKARIFLEIPTASANQSAQVRINGISVNASKNTRVAYLNNLIINTADNYSLIEIEKSNNIIEASWVINKKTTGFGNLTKGLSENYVRECENDENINSIYVVVSNSDVLFPIGTRIVVKGVKAE